MTADAATTRRRERLRDLADTALRAGTGHRGLHHRGEDLYNGDRRVPSLAVHLYPDPDAAMRSLRGVADAVWLRITTSDVAAHAARRPSEPAARTVFDLLEQLRVESVVPASLPGVRRNLAARFADWSSEFLASGLAETSLGLMVFAIAHTARARVLAVPIPPDLEDTLEHMRFSLAERIGAPLRQLRPARHDQAAYAVPALALASIATDLAREAAADDAAARGSRSGGSARFALFDRDEDDTDDEDADPVPLGASRTLASAGDRYRVFTAAHDETADATALVRAPALHRLRRDLDAAVFERRLDRYALTVRLSRLLSRLTVDGWDGAQEEGELDGRRLAQLVAARSRDVFRQPRAELRADAHITLLLDCSGSMRAHRHDVATAVDVLHRVAGLADVGVEVLGYTTRSWAGGRARQDWVRAGSPVGAGRVAERRHLVFAPSGTDYRRARLGLAGLLRADLYKEGLDGEALDWACRRALAQPAHRRVVVVVSDGSPAEAATAAATDENYLRAHLRHVVDRWAANGGVTVAGLGVGLDLSLYYDRHEAVDLADGGAQALLDGFLALMARA